MFKIKGLKVILELQQNIINAVNDKSFNREGYKIYDLYYTI